MKPQITRLSIVGAIACAIFFTSSPAGAEATVTTGECIQMTWFGGKAGAKGKTVKGHIDSATGKGTYDWQHGTLAFSQQGDENGRLNGMEGSWKQDGSEGTFAVKGSYYDAPAQGTWSVKGNKKKNKLSIAVCK